MVGRQTASLHCHVSAFGFFDYSESVVPSNSLATLGDYALIEGLDGGGGGPEFGIQ